MKAGSRDLKSPQSLFALDDQTASERAANLGNVMYSTVSSSLMYSVHTFACNTQQQRDCNVRLILTSEHTCAWAALCHILGILLVFLWTQP